MKGDFSRIRYAPEKHYTRVLKQQGRVDLDSDWNEQSLIFDRLDRQKAIDIIGHCGVPKKGGGFKIVANTFLNDVAFPTATKGWAVGNDGNIISSNDGGGTWNMVAPPSSLDSNLYKISFPAEDTGWVAGENTTILKIEPDPQSNGVLISKQTVVLSAPIHLMGISFADLNNGWACGEKATIIATTDGGNTWTQQFLPAGVEEDLKDIFFLSTTKGWAVGENATILNTSDGGENWTLQSAPESVVKNLNSIHFTSETNGWIVGDKGTILQTTDGGQTWNSQIITDLDVDLNDVFFESAAEGWMVGDKGTILHTLNTGDEWNKDSSGLNSAFLAVNFESGLGCIVGRRGAILTRQVESTAWTAQDIPDDFRFSLVATDGRIYVDGLCCDLDENTSYFNQPNYPNPPDIVKVDGQTDLIYLDVWERHITAIEDPDIREVALGGPDTTTRVKTIFQLKIVPDVEAKNCKQNIEGWPPEAGKGRLTTRAEADAASDQPCIIEPGGGYRGLDNRLYRVEIHTPGDIGTATFKWSRDNGSVAYAIESFKADDPKQIKVKQLGKDDILRLKKGDWVEILGDETELKGNPGTIAQIDDIKEAQRIVILSADVSAHSNETHPKIRRWDQKAETVLVETGKISLEKGVEIEFSGEDFRTGDYWVFAARTSTAEVEELTDAPPMGIEHHYCKLALVTWNAQSNGKWQADIQDCRKDFPSLTEICAEDICFDNSVCEFPETETVQDAIERLCAANNLKFHNKHLHGWGIVCGLQVYCGDDVEKGRLTVKVKEGYALDCNGNDLVVKADKNVPVMKMIKELGLLDGKDGEVCLTIGLNKDNNLAFNIEPYDPNDKSNEWKGGELVQNIYNNCLKPIIDFFKEEVTGDGKETPLVSIYQKRITTLLNLLIQFLTPEFGKRVYISPQEDVILRELYNSLRELLKSKTYCAMFDNAQQFPEYPGSLAEMNIPTVFSKGYKHTRIRIDHQGTRAYTTGGVESPSGSNKIFVFDLSSQKMVSELEIPGGIGVKVQDVAISSKGTELYAVGLVNDEDTIFAVADIKDGEELTFTWRPIKTFCDILMVTLATVDFSNSVFAIARGDGLFVVDPNAIDTESAPSVVFSATGHLVVDNETHIAYATLGNNLDDPLQYNEVRGMNLDDLKKPFQTFSMKSPQGNSMVGEDDIAIASGAKGRLLCAVVNPIDGAANHKNLLVYNIDTNANNAQPRHLVDLGENTDMHLAHNPVTGYMMVTMEDSYRVRLVSLFDRDIPQLVDSYHHPVQIYPESIALGPSSDRQQQVFVYNWVSNTFNIIPAKRFQPEATFPLEELTAYRNDVLEAYLDLFGKFTQYLKDCICDQLLLKCPTCDEDDKIYLACVSIRDNQVYKVCNFSKRKYVKSFQAFDYWLSWIPLGPMVRKAVESVCCAVLPDLFENVNIGGKERTGVNVKGTQVKYGFANVNMAQFSTMFNQRKAQASVIQSLAGDWFSNISKKQVATPERKVRQDSIVDKPVDEVQTKFQRANIEVVSVEEYNPVGGIANLRKFTTAPTNLKENQRVILYQENGKVKYYAVADKGPVEVEDLRTKVNLQEGKIAEATKLQEQRLSEATKLQDEKLAEAQKTREAEIAELRKQQEARIAELTKAQSDKIAEANVLQEQKITEVTKLQDEKLAEALKTREAEIAEIRKQQENRIAELTKLQEAKLAEAQKAQEAEIAQLKKLQEDRIAELTKVQADKIAEVRALQDQKSTEVKGLQDELVNLRKQLIDVQAASEKAITTRDREITDLKVSVQRLSTVSTDFAALRKQVDQLTKRG